MGLTHGAPEGSIVTSRTQDGSKFLLKKIAPALEDVQEPYIRYASSGAIISGTLPGLVEKLLSDTTGEHLR